MPDWESLPQSGGSFLPRQEESSAAGLLGRAGAVTPVVWGSVSCDELERGPAYSHAFAVSQFVGANDFRFFGTPFRRFHISPQ
jgi:hypothetical protein